MSGRTSWILTPDVDSQLIRDRGEVKVDEVGHHWIAYLPQVLECLAAVGLVVLAFWGPIELGAIFLLAALAVFVHAGWRALWVRMDRFVVTNIRVFRVTGVLNRKTAATPLRRILDITQSKPLTGRLLGYGHFVFESAAQEQGLREIRNVPHPDELNYVIQRELIDQGLHVRVSQDER